MYIYTICIYIKCAKKGHREFDEVNTECSPMWLVAWI